MFPALLILPQKANVRRTEKRVETGKSPKTRGGDIKAVFVRVLGGRRWNGTAVFRSARFESNVEHEPEKGHNSESMERRICPRSHTTKDSMEIYDDR
ncbi:unnamed protein product [Victoria cruziana]